MDDDRDDKYLPNDDGESEPPDPIEPIRVPDEDPKTDEVPG
jgi:hypothetical protein